MRGAAGLGQGLSRGQAARSPQGQPSWEQKSGLGTGARPSVLEGSSGGLCWCAEPSNGFSFCSNEMIFSLAFKVR